MKKLEYQVRFNTPAFLGNAEQKGQWRTPPFKALLRQWWRVVKARDLSFDVDQLRVEEGKLFGAASDNAGVSSHKARVSVRLTHWNTGSLDTWNGDSREPHPEVTRNDSVMQIGAQLYLGYGPLDHGDTGQINKHNGKPKKGTILSKDPQRTAVDQGQTNRLRVTLPEKHVDELCQTTQLAAWFGTLGSRSRNGWGALHLEHQHLQPLTKANLESLRVTRDLHECLQLDWPHAVGKDQKGPLVWTTNVTGSWHQVMKELARIKIAFRTQPALSLHGVPSGRFAERHFLAYPVTHHIVNGQHWGDQARIANQIRFKVAETVNGQLTGIIVHLPCALPRQMADAVGNAANEHAAAQAWQAVHQVLDTEAQRLQ